VVISPYVLALGGSVVVGAGFVVTTWRRRTEPGTRALAVLLLSVVFWAGLYAISLLTPALERRLLLERFLWVGTVASPVAWFVFTLQYTGYGDWVTRRRVVGLSVVPVAVLALVWTNPLHNLLWSNPRMVATENINILVRSFGPVFWVHLAYAYTLALAGLVFLLRLVFTAEYMFVDQALALVVGALAPIVASAVTVTGLSPVPGLDLTPIAFSISGVTFGYALLHSELLDRVPAARRIGRNTIVRNIRDGVVVIDDDEVVIDMNSVAERLFDLDRSEAIGSAFRPLLDCEVELPEEKRTVIWSGQGPTRYEVKVSLLTDQHDRQVGRVLVIRDITDRTNRQQQLQVLNRVLRHNFRNDMNVIDVCATQLAERLDDDNQELADRIRMTARDLTETGTKAREIERIMSRRYNEPQPVDLTALVMRLTDTIQHEYPVVDVSLELPDELEIEATGILESVLQNVLENAVIHNDSSDPEIEVVVRALGSALEKVEIAVADNGPGIPEQERQVLTKGTETPLEHGSGLGLWLVNWGVTMLGGEVEFEDNDPRGSIVTIRVPRTLQTAAAAEPEPPSDPPDRPPIADD
jgi:signal transduction histidine kinase